MARQSIQVLIVEDHAMVREGLKLLLGEFEDISVIGEAANGLEAIHLAQTLQPDVVLMDLLMPELDGHEAIQRIRTLLPHQRIIVLTGLPAEDHLISSIREGAMGYLQKDAHPEDVVEAIRQVHAGNPWLAPAIAWQVLHDMDGASARESKESPLTGRELAVLRLLALGLTDSEIAASLFIADVTVRSHVSRILIKLGINNRVQAALFGIRSGLVSIDEMSDEVMAPQRTFPMNPSIGVHRISSRDRTHG
jgi:DNA-binding NarL/FixJ family response regulator